MAGPRFASALLVIAIVGCAQPPPPPSPTPTPPLKAVPTEAPKAAPAKEAKPEAKQPQPQAKETKPEPVAKKVAKPETFIDNRLMKELDDSGFIKRLYND